MTEDHSDLHDPSSSAPQGDDDVAAAGSQPGSSTRRRGPLVLGALLGVILAAALLPLSRDFFVMRNLVTVSPETQAKIDSGELDGGAVMGAIMGENDLGELAKKASAEKRSVAVKNNTLALGLVGLAVCGAFGLAAGVGRRSSGEAVVGLLLGVVLGTLLGVAAALAGSVVNNFLRQAEVVAPAIQTVLGHATTWLILALAAGVTIGFHRRASSSLARTIGAAAVGALLAACIYSPTAGFLFPMEQSELLVPDGIVNRIYWVSLFAFGVALAVIYTDASAASAASAAAR